MTSSAPTRRHVLQATALGLAAHAMGCAKAAPPLRIGSIVFPGYEPLFLARDLGWLREEQVRLVELFSSRDALRGLAAGQLEGAMLTLDEVLSALSTGLSLQIVAMLDRSDGADVVLAHPHLEPKASLIGRTIAYEEGAVGAMVLAHFLRAFQLRPDQIKRVPTTLMESAAAMKTGKADLVVTAEPWLSELEAFGARRLFDSRAIPWRIVDVLAVRTDVVEEQAQHIQHAVTQHHAALDYWQRKPDEAARRIAPRLGLKPEAVPQVLRGLIQPSREAARSWMRPGSDLQDTLEVMQREMLADGLLPHIVPTDSLFVPRFLD